MNGKASVLKKRHTEIKKDAESGSLKSVFLGSFKGLAIGVAAALLILFVLCAAAMRSPDPASLTRPVSYAALLLCAFIAGTAAAKINKGGYFDGLICGVMYVVFVSVVSLFISGSDVRPHILISLGLRVAAVLASVLGGIAGRKKEKKPKKRKKY